MIYSIAIYLIEAYGCFSDVDMIYSITIYLIEGYDCFSDVHMIYSIDIYLIEAYGCFFQKYISKKMNHNIFFLLNKSQGV
jgi:hypothetical protein